MKWLAPSVAILGLACLVPHAQAQDNLDRRIRQNQARLDSIRDQRSSLEGELRRLRGRTPSSTEILCILHETSPEYFRNKLDPFLIREERDLLTAAGPLAHQAAIAYDHVVERLTRRWAELHT